MLMFSVPLYDAFAFSNHTKAWRKGNLFLDTDKRFLKKFVVLFFLTRNFYLCLSICKMNGSNEGVMYRFLATILLSLFLSSAVFGSRDTAAVKVYVFPIRSEIMPATVSLTAKCLEQAQAKSVDCVVIDMNTYGGLLDAADSIRTMLLNFPLPVFTFVNNQAISAGALIAIASDSIYMRPGASIGAATVVDQNSNALPDKYQSFMRSMMRSTAEAHGKKTAGVTEKGDTLQVWRRDPQIAQAMVDPSIRIEGIVDSAKVLTLTTDEAIECGYCEGKANSVEEVLVEAGMEEYQLIEYHPTLLDRLLGFLTNPAVQGIFIMLIVGGIYFELQTPGVGFPLAVAIVGAVLYFSPLYMEGLLANWELIVFVLGVLLVILEIFVTPGFGVLGILGIVAVVTGLAFAIIDTSLLKYIPTGEVSVGVILEPLLVVVISISTALLLSFWLGKRFLTGRSGLRDRVVLISDMKPEEGYVAHRPTDLLTGRKARTATPLRPAGRVEIDGIFYDAAGEDAQFIERGVEVLVVRSEGGVLYCRKTV